MKAFDRGLTDGRLGSRRDRARTYESDKAEKEYWRGYVLGVEQANPGKAIVQCERDGTIFTIPTMNTDRIDCPTCGRGYIKEDHDFVSDRKLTVLLNLH